MGTVGSGAAFARTTSGLIAGQTTMTLGSGVRPSGHVIQQKITEHADGSSNGIVSGRIGEINSEQIGVVINKQSIAGHSSSSSYNNSYPAPLAVSSHNTGQITSG
jgi:hypothetical protein